MKRNTEPFSLLMSVYSGETAPCLDRALRSVISEQLLPPDEVILVEDGPLNEGLYEVIGRWKKASPLLKTVTYPENRGLEYALNRGLEECSYEWVARMDSDDISLPERFLRQMEYLAENPDTDVLGCSVAEFETDEKHIVSYKSTPADITAFIRFRSPVNHPTVVYRKSSVMKAGGYRDCRFMEDYHLWIRMHALGMKITALQEPLYLFKMDSGTLKRRGGMKYVRSEAKIQKLLLENGLVTLPRYFFNICVRCGVRMIPGSLRGYLYRKLMRGRAIAGLSGA